MVGMWGGRWTYESWSIGVAARCHECWLLLGPGRGRRDSGGESLGGLGVGALWFDTTVRRLPVGSPRTGWGPAGVRGGRLGGLGAGVLWFDSSLRKTPGRLTTNGGGPVGLGARKTGGSGTRPYERTRGRVVRHGSPKDSHPATSTSSGQAHHERVGDGGCAEEAGWKRGRCAGSGRNGGVGKE